MKQSAVRTLGTTALGAAFVAAAAGSAGAAVAPGLPDAASALGVVTNAVPLGQLAGQLPPGGAEALKAGTDVLGMTTTTVPAAAGHALPQLMPAGGGADPVGGLLGGLPTGGALPTGGLPTGAVPGLGG